MTARNVLNKMLKDQQIIPASRWVGNNLNQTEKNNIRPTTSLQAGSSCGRKGEFLSCFLPP